TGVQTCALPICTAIRPAEFDEFFTAEGNRTGTAVAGTYVDLGLIEEFHDFGQSSFGSDGVSCSATARGTRGRISAAIPTDGARRPSVRAHSVARPVPEARPGLAVEPVTLHRHPARDDGIDHPLAGILEAAFMHDAARGRIDHPARDMQDLDVGRLESEIDQRVRRLGRIASVPV